MPGALGVVSEGNVVKGCFKVLYSAGGASVSKSDSTDFTPLRKRNYGRG